MSPKILQKTVWDLKWVEKWKWKLVTQSCPTFCVSMGCSLPDSSVHGILQAREHLPFPSPGDLPDPGMEPESPALQDRFFTNWITGEAQNELNWTKTFDSASFSCITLGCGVEYYSVFKKNEILTFVTTWMDLEHKSEMSQAEKDKYCRIPSVYGILTNKANEQT